MFVSDKRYGPVDVQPMGWLVAPEYTVGLYPKKETEMDVKKSVVEFKSVSVPGHGEVKLSKGDNGCFNLEGLVVEGKRMAPLGLNTHQLKLLHALFQSVLLDGVK